MRSKIKLSQCMIVKNEEKNIRQALSWAKGIAFEQIVVDTGSTDKTVEIAEEMGAKVYHFAWIDDFSAAKNFAIEQATGDWIAFLDADEYFKSEDIKYLIPYLEEMEEHNRRKDYLNILRLPWLQLNDDGEVFSTSVQDRVFLNRPWLRYINRIHEKLHSFSEQHELKIYQGGMELPIYHTGYAKEVYAQTKKGERNIQFLLKELDETPNNRTVWGYLGDAYAANGDWKKAQQAWQKAVYMEEGEMELSNYISAAVNLMRYYLKEEKEIDNIEKLYDKLKDVPKERADLEYWMGIYCFQKKRHQEGIVHLEAALVEMQKEDNLGAYYCTGNLNTLYRNLLNGYTVTKQYAKAVEYAVQLLRTDNRQADILAVLLGIFAYAGEKTEAVYGFLEKLYPLNDLETTVFVAKAAKEAGDLAMMKFLLDPKRLEKLGLSQK